MSTADRSRTPGSGRLPALLLLPLALYAYPALAGLAGRSENPVFLGRFSTTFLAFNVWSLAACALLLAAWYLGRPGLLQWSCLLLAATTVMVPANNQLRGLPGILVLLPLIRLACGLSMVVAGFEGRRRAGARPAGLAMGLGSLLVVLSLLDLVLMAVLAGAPEHRRLEAGYRAVPELATLGTDDLVLVGDSFVWGQGVEVRERMGDRLEEKLSATSPATRVFSLGRLGDSTHQYAESIRSIPDDRRARRIVVALYLNDMPAPETLRDKIQNVSAGLGRGFPTLRLVGDMGAKLLVRDVDAYHGFLVDTFADDHPTFAARRDLLRTQLTLLYDLAAPRSAAPPLLVILPLMVDYAEYPLEETHHDLARLAGEAGFETLDLLPLFRRELRDGSRFRVTPDDNHFDAGTHDLVASEIARHVAAAPGDR